MIFNALNWDARDIDHNYTIRIFGRSEDGKSVSVITKFEPYFFIRAPPHVTDDTGALLIFNQVCESCYKMNNGQNAPIEAKVFKRKDLWGFTNNKEFHFIRFKFRNQAGMKACARSFQKKYRVYESNIDPLLRFMHVTQIQSTGWLEANGKTPTTPLTRCDVELHCDDWTTLKPVARDDLAPFVICSFDIETNSSTGKFPDASILGDSVFQIAMTYRRQGADVHRKVCLCYKETTPFENPEDGEVICFPTEADLLLAFSKELRDNDVDVLTGYNIFGFDLDFLYKRSRHLGFENGSEFFQMSKLRDDLCEMKLMKLSSSALGDNKMKVIPMVGRFVFDLYMEIKKEKKLSSYKLDDVSLLYLNDQKINMPVKEMFRRFQDDQNPQQADLLREVALYCVKDTLLPHRLIDKLCTFLNMVEMAKAAWVPINYLAERGQQIKVFSLVSKKARELGFMVPFIAPDRNKTEGDDVGYKGATVLNAEKGAYYTPITALDFASLYPSIMRAHNLCYSTMVRSPTYDHLPGIVYERFEVDGKVHTFAQNVPSLLPAILNDLVAFRNQAKKDMKNNTGFMKSIYDGKQLAYKLLMNSVYGFTGAGFAMLPAPEIASTVTCKGRSMIEETKNCVEANFPGAKVRYGDTDSVMVEFDVQGRTGQEAVQYSWELGELASEMCTKLFKAPNDLELEKVYYPYILYSKKRYAAKMWVKHGDGVCRLDKDKPIDIKGLQVVRRDTILYTRKVCKKLLNVILESPNPDEAIRMAKEAAETLLNHDVEIDDLVMSQQLADNYKSSNLPHVNVRDKMRQREPGSEPQSGDRVPFVIVETEDENAQQYEKAEDPAYVKLHGITLDYYYYFTNKFVQPVSDLLEPLVTDAKNIIFGDLFVKKRKARGRGVLPLPKGQKLLSDFFKKL